VVEQGGGIRLAVWSAGTLAECAIESETHYTLDRAGIWADCVRKGRPVVHNELNPEDYRRGLPEGHCPLTRHLAVPVLEKGVAVMVLGVGNKAGPLRRRRHRPGAPAGRECLGSPAAQGA
jgi:hypothetical protein